MKLSLIIPIYKAEEFLPRLFENLEAQDVFFDDKEFGEAIFVNDGSPDNSESIILDYAKKHPWVKYIKQENQGQHVARNTGIMAAKGEYIAFMDQDDAYTTNALKLLLVMGEKNDADVVRGKAKWPTDESFREWENYPNLNVENINVYSGWDFIEKTNGLCYTTMIWGTVYNTKFIKNNKIYFPIEVSYFEDGAYNWELMLKNPKVITISNIVYFWIQRSQSESHNVNLKHRVKRESKSEQLAVFMYSLSKSYCNHPRLPIRIKNLLSILPYWICYKYLGTMIKLNGLQREGINPTIRRLRQEGIYPYPHSFPKDLPEGYPSSLKYKIMWRLMSYEWILKLMLRLRARK